MSDVNHELTAKLLTEVLKIGAEVSAVKETVIQQGQQIQPIIADHETRLRTMEKGKWRMAGIAAGAGAVIGFAAQHLPKIGNS